VSDNQKQKKDRKEKTFSFPIGIGIATLHLSHFAPAYRRQVQNIKFFNEVLNVVG